MEKREIDLTVSCYGKVKGVKYDVVILPWGATEPHNLHLPYLTDCILPHDIAVDAAALALQNSGVRCMVMPPVPFGAHNPGQRELPFCIHTRYSTQQAILEDIVASLYAQGMRKLIILSGHGGNNFKGMIRDLAFVYPDFLIIAADWFSIVPPKDYFEAVVDDHAGESETSVMMHYHPELVNLAEHHLKGRYAQDGQLHGKADEKRLVHGWIGEHPDVKEGRALAAHVKGVEELAQGEGAGNR